MPFVLARIRTWGTWCLALTTFVAALGFVAASMRVRPFAPVEAELVYEAYRVHHSLPLYVDPSVGAWDAGAPPSRYFVLYTPTWPMLLGAMPWGSLEALRNAGRLLNELLWFGLLATVVSLAPRENKLMAALGGLLAGALYFLVREVTVASADTLAVCLGGLGLLCTVRRGRLDFVACVLLVAAPFVKPSALGIAGGTFLAHLFVHRARAAREVGIGALAALAFAVVCHDVSGGAWLVHIRSSTLQPLDLDRWISEFGSRSFVLGLPHALVLAITWKRGSPYSRGAGIATLAWSTFSMAKHGSGTQYWLEPTIAALVQLAFWRHEEVSERIHQVGSWLAFALAAAVATVSLPAYFRDLEHYRDSAATLTELDHHCVRKHGEVVIVGDIGTELVLNGRFLVPLWQSSYLARKSRFPLEAWRQDVARPEVRWFVHGLDFRDPPPSEVDRGAEVSAFRKELRSVVDEHFEFDAQIGTFLVYRRRNPAPSSPIL